VRRSARSTEVLARRSRRMYQVVGSKLDPREFASGSSTKPWQAAELQKPCVLESTHHCELRTFAIRADGGQARRG